MEPLSNSEEIVVSPEGHRFSFRPISCPTCESAQTRAIGVRGGDYHRYGHGIATRIVQCTSCSLLYPNPFPYPVDDAALYGDPSKYFEHHDEKIKIDLFRKLVVEIREHTRKSDPSILDVGSGRGELLRSAQLEGITDTVGLELSPAMIEYTKNKHHLTVYPYTIEQYAERESRTFDVVVLNAVLEHVHNPDIMIAAASKLTAPGATLYIDVPNEPNLLTRVGNTVNRLRGNQGVFNLAPTFPPYHVFGFNRRSLETLLRKHGFSLTSFHVYAYPVLHAQGGPQDRFRAFVGTQINRFANLIADSGNLYAWARRD